ncbi:hypothetical protein J1N35_029363 [Gossypium stocksii]|uniref:RNase H type-1 domain-containing protein n=1 Tax=Gossypium stocksii TaxID=47602 RepID=A0A9D3UXS5_9ROSI|nr:hypothetical protein J1N35_029363 [Gossypium stocksii]
MYGIVHIDSGNVAADGVVRNANGDGIFGLIQRRGYDEVIIQSDSLEVVKAILDSTSTKTYSALIRCIQSILSQEKWLRLRYIPRDQNQVVDCLVKQALIGTDNLQVPDTPHPMTHTLMDLGKNKHVLSFQSTIL